MKTKNRAGHLVCLHDPRSPVAEAFRTLRTNIQFAGVNRELQMLLITSAEPKVGKTTTLSNLGIVMAQADQRVLVIDADMRRPMLHSRLALSNRYGLSNLLIRQVEMEDVVQEMPEVKGMHVITSGPIPPNPADLLGSERMRELLEQARASYDMILIDSPPLLPVTDAQVLARQVDGALLVVSSGQTQREEVKRAKGLLDHVDGHLIGAVLNNTKTSMSGYYYG
ncbi:MAG: CpsD/CapB family tyrosine-protein kinase [Tumebacillaceae bacterium]